MIEGTIVATSINMSINFIVANLNIMSSSIITISINLPSNSSDIRNGSSGMPNGEEQHFIWLL